MWMAGSGSGGEEVDGRPVEGVGVGELTPCGSGVNEDELAAGDGLVGVLAARLEGTTASESPWMMNVGTVKAARSARKSVRPKTPM